MSKDSFEDFQYNSCISRGICSINPRISALQTVLVLHLKLFAKYTYNSNVEENIQTFILNKIPLAINNINLNDESFLFVIKEFKKYLLQKIKDTFETINNSEKEEITNLFNKTTTILDSIKYGESIYNQNLKNISQEIRNLYNILLVIIKDLSINLLELKNLGKECQDGFKTILTLLKSLDINEINFEELKEIIQKAAKFDYEIMKFIRCTQEEIYGNQMSKQVSFSTEPGKAVLVVGSDIKELEEILEALKNEEIAVYTHDEMILAYTFPKFSEYQNLKGHYGQGIENCLIDFATFPGPIILTKNSLHNIENFYRGLLFTTDTSSTPKGVIKIKNKDFTEVIKSAKDAKGFKKGKKCETVTIGYNYEDVIKNINNMFETNNYEQAIIIGLNDSVSEQKDYYKNLIKLIPKDILVISFSYNSEKENFIHINSCYDNLSWTKVLDFLIGLDIPTTVFIPKCNKGTFSQVIYYSEFENTSFFIDNCKPILYNPSLIRTFSKEFGVKKISDTKKDLQEFNKDK